MVIYAAIDSKTVFNIVFIFYIFARIYSEMPKEK